NALISVNVTSTSDLRKAVLKTHPWDENYNKNIHGDLDWVRNSMYNLLRLYESDELEHPHLEQWFNIHVWLWRFFDTVFDTMKRIEVVRGESSSKASAVRKNLERVVCHFIRRHLGELCLPKKKKKSWMYLAQ
ncbi:hypothetical protein DM01DRAFT_1388497, partial [Hesseltinella vesiculosa]